MNPLLALVASLSLAAAAPAAVPAPAPAAPSGTVVDRVAATVNGEVITLRQLEDRAGDEWRRAEAMDPGPARDAAEKAALRRAFDAAVADNLFDAQLKALGIEVSETEIDDAVENIKRAQKLDDHGIEQALASEGLDLQTFRQKVVRKQLESYKLLNMKVRNRVKVTDEDLQNYWQQHQADFGGDEQVHVLHIFLPLAKDASAAQVKQARAQADRALQRLRTGESFAAVAKDVSQGPGADDGGDLGWIARGTIQRSLEDVVFGLKDGQISGVVRAGPGLHIFEVVGHRRAGGKTFEQAKDQIRDLLTNEQLDTYRQQYLDELKRDAVIVVNMPELKDQTASAK